MKKLIFTAVVIVLSVCLTLFTVLKFVNNYFSEYVNFKYSDRVNTWNYTNKKVENGSVVFLGDSITEEYNLNEYFAGLNVINRGIYGDTTEGVISRLKVSVYDIKPAKVFLMIGTNDLGKFNKSPQEIVENIKKIVSEIRSNLPNTKIYIQSIYPVNRDIGVFNNSTLILNRNNDSIKIINEMLANIEDTVYIDVYSSLVKNGQLDLKYTREGLHLNSNGYEVVTETLLPFVEN